MGTAIKKYPGLDGLRILAAVCLVLGHTGLASICRWGGTPITSLPLPLQVTDLFLVITGFVAGYRAFSIDSTAQYYRRRASRLLPIFYGYIIVTVAVLSLLGFGHRVLTPNLLYYLFLVPNLAQVIPGAGIIPLAHLWFVGTIVLFYLVVPPLAKTKAHRRHLISIIAIGILFAAKVIGYFLAGKDTILYRLINVSGYDSILLGFLVGSLLHEGWKPLSRISDSPLLVILAWILFLTTGLYGKYIPSVIRPEYVSLLSVILILGQGSDRPLPRLENRFCRWLGGISYQIYVVQLLVIILLSLGYSQQGLHWCSAAIYCVSLASVILVAWLVSLLENALRKK